MPLVCPSCWHEIRTDSLRFDGLRCPYCGDAIDYRRTEETDRPPGPIPGDTWYVRAIPLQGGIIMLVGALGLAFDPVLGLQLVVFRTAYTMFLAAAALYLFRKALRPGNKPAGPSKGLIEPIVYLPIAGVVLLGAISMRSITLILISCLWLSVLACHIIWAREERHGRQLRPQP